MIKMTTAMDRLSPYGPKQKATINTYCLENRIPAKRNGDLWMFDEKYISSAINWRMDHVTLDEILTDRPTYNVLPKEVQKQCYRQIRKIITPFITNDLQYRLLFSGILLNKNDAEKIKLHIDDISKLYEQKTNLIPVKDAAGKMGLSVFQLKNKIKEGNVQAVRLKNDWYLPADSVNNYNTTKEKYIGIYDFVKSGFADIRTLFDIENARDRAALFLKIKNSDLSSYVITWEQSGLHGDRRNALYFPNLITDKMTSAIETFLRQYGSLEARYNLLITDSYWDSHPKTFEALNEFSSDKVPAGMCALMESIIYTVTPEIMDCTDEDIKDFIAYVIAAPHQIYRLYAAKFTAFLQDEYTDCKFRTVLNFDYSGGKQNVIQVQPYPFHMYMAGAYLAFSDEIIEKQRLREKALRNKKHAYLWLYMIWHYVGAWRSSDFFRLHPVQLPANKDVVKQQILDNSFDKEADRLSIILESEINNRQMVPRKTQNRQHNEYLTVSFPETLRTVIGTAYAICSIHCNTDTFEQQRFEAADYIDFFGPSYEQVFGRNPFLNRRANKSFLDAIATITEKNSDTKTKTFGYLVASYARGHHTAEGKLSDVTYKYLESRLDGYSVNEILMMLWETGACSFVPYMLMETVYGDAYSSLDVVRQNNLLIQSGLTAITAENISSLVQKVYTRSQAIVDRIFYSYNQQHSRETVAKQMIENIITNRALGKNYGIICLCAARKMPCANQAASECFGCPWAVYQRGVTYFALQRIKEKYHDLEKARTAGEKQKIRGVLETVYLPAYYEVLLFSKEHYGIDVSSYKDEVIQLLTEGGIAIADSNNNE